MYNVKITLKDGKIKEIKNLEKIIQLWSYDGSQKEFIENDFDRLIIRKGYIYSFISKDKKEIFNTDGVEIVNLDFSK